MQNNTFMYSEDQLMARLKFFIGICLALTLTGIVFVVLYSIIFVTQPLNAISPIDQKFFELIIPVATFLTGTLSGIMLAGGSKEETDAKMAMMRHSQDVANTYAKANPVRVEPTLSTTSGFNGTAVPQPQTIMVNGKLAPLPAPQPEI